MAYTRTNFVRPVAIGYMTDTMGRMHSDAQFAGRNSASHISTGAGDEWIPRHR